MEVLDIIQVYLEDNQYGGLYNDYCACTKEDLAPCGEMQQKCQAGYKHTHSVTGEHIISSIRQPLTDGDIQEVLDSI